MSQQESDRTTLDDNVLDRLETLLDDPALEEAMRLDEIQGYLCAALSGPRPIDPENRLFDILGSEEALESAAGREAAGLIGLLADALEKELAAGEPLILLLYPKDDSDDAPSDYLPWCQAYLAGVDQAELDWFEHLENNDDEDSEAHMEYLDERLFPLMVLTGEAQTAAEEHGEEWPQGEEAEAIEQECEEDLGQAVSDIYRFWLAKRGTGTFRLQEPKTGRNDPCPCGSGRKFKQCCGRES